MKEAAPLLAVEGIAKSFRPGALGTILVAPGPRRACVDVQLILSGDTHSAVQLVGAA